MNGRRVRIFLLGGVLLAAASGGVCAGPPNPGADGELALAVGFTNDNYTGSVENGIAGRYLGADDFLTFGMFALGRLARFDLDLRYQIVTSRLFGWRYDLIRAGLGYRFERGHWLLVPRLGLLLKGNWGGQSLQNGFHRMKDIPELTLPYAEGGFAPVFGGRFDYRASPVRAPALSWRAGVEWELPVGIKPLWVSAGLGGQAACRFALLELDGGWRQYLSQAEGYSELVRSGWFGGFRVTIRFRGVAGGGGILMFPARNLDNDPLYADQVWNWSPQIWMAGGLRADAFSLRDTVYY